jgi:hypothetical protein
MQPPKGNVMGWNNIEAKWAAIVRSHGGTFPVSGSDQPGDPEPPPPGDPASPQPADPTEVPPGDLPQPAPMPVPDPIPGGG